jgi:hypothetical protein
LDNCWNSPGYGYTAWYCGKDSNKGENMYKHIEKKPFLTTIIGCGCILTIDVLRALFSFENSRLLLWPAGSIAQVVALLAFGEFMYQVVILKKRESMSRIVVLMAVVLLASLPLIARQAAQMHRLAN